MSAKGSALGANVPEGGVVSSRAPLPRASGNGTKRSRESDTGTNSPEAGITDTPETSHPALSSSVRTIILGIDYDGRIVQHDRIAPRILAREPEELLGAQLSDLTTRPPEGAAAVGGLLEAIRADRQSTAILTVQTGEGRSAEAVVTVHPM